MQPTRALLVIELEITHPDQVAEAIKAIDPPSIPYFKGSVRVTMDAFGEGPDNPATAILGYLEGSDE